MKKVIKITENQFRNIIENSILKEHSVFNDPKALALVNFLNDTEQEEEYGLSEIIPLKYDHYGLTQYKVKDRKYIVGTDEEANIAFKEYMEDLIDEVGIDGFNPNLIIHYIDIEWFKEALSENYESYIEVIRNEKSTDPDKWESRLQEEMEENEDEFLEKMIDEAGDPVEHFKVNFGEEEFSDTIKRHNLINLDELIDGVKDSDGRGPSLSEYDGQENKYGDYYIYRTN